MTVNLFSPISGGHENDPLTEIFVSHADASRFAEVLSLLSKHFIESMIVTGSFAVEWQVRKKNGDARKRPLNDIDVVALKGLAGIGNSLRTDFLIHHFHPTRETGNVLIQLVEPKTETRIDVFSPRTPSLLERTSKVNIDGTDCDILSAEDLAARLLAIVGAVLDGVSVDPKYLDSLQRIIKSADTALTARLWKDYRRSGDSPDLNEVLNAVTIRVRERGDLLKPTEYSHDVNAECVWCVESDDFPLAPRSEIFEILGYL